MKHLALGLVLFVVLAAKAEDHASVKRGEYIFMNRCVMCHFPDTRKTRVGPGMKGIISQSSFFPVSKKRVSLKFFKELLKKPAGIMPGFKDLSPRDLEDLYRYLEGL